jgi:hypothetical protein
MEKSTNLHQVIETFRHIMLYRVHISLNGNRTYDFGEDFVMLVSNEYKRRYSI